MKSDRLYLRRRFPQLPEPAEVVVFEGFRVALSGLKLLLEAVSM